MMEREPSIAVADAVAEHDVVIVNPQGLTEEAAVVGRRLRAVLSRG